MEGGRVNSLEQPCVRLAATFTADPLRAPLEFVLAAAGMDVAVTLALRRRVYKFMGRVAIHQSNLRLLIWPDRYDYVLDRMQRVRKISWRRWRRVKNDIAANYEQMMGRAIPAHLMRTQKAILEALAAYRYPPYSGKVTLFRARSQPIGAIPDRHGLALLRERRHRRARCRSATAR